MRFSLDEKVRVARCVVTTCLAANSIPSRKFDFLFVDEAGQATEPDILIPIAAAPQATVDQIEKNESSYLFVYFVKTPL